MIKKYLCLLGLSILVACQAPQNAPFQVTDFRGEQPILLPVGQIKVDNQTIRYTELPHLETRIPVTPVFALTEALKNRFTPEYPDTDINVTFIIHEADLTQKAKETDHWYILDNVEYLLTYRVDVVYEKAGLILEKQQFSGWEKQALPQKSSLSQKERVWEKMINAMIQKSADKIEADRPS